MPWNLTRVNADVVQDLGYIGQDILVGVIDSGLDIRHPAFAGRIDGQSRNFVGPDVAAVEDPDGHGTHVAGIIAAGRGTGPMYGIAPGARILALRAIDDDNDNDDDDDDGADGATAQALYYAAAHQVKVVNGSYGPNAMPPKFIESPTGRWVLNPTYQELPHQILLFNEDEGLPLDQPEAKAIQAATAADVVMVFAAGNEYGEQPVASANPSGNGILPYISPEHHDTGVYRFISVSEDTELFDPNDPNTYDYLAPNDPRLANVDYSHLKGTLIAVVATDNADRIASYSNRCGVAWQWCMAAPGGDGDNADDGILSTVPSGYGVMSGTSMASPLVAGAAAVLRGRFPYLDARQIIELLLTTTNHSGHLADRAIYGRGMLDIARAIQGPREFGAEGFNAVFDVNTQGYNSAWSGDIIGSGGLTKRGAGTLALSGTNTYTGDTTVAGGTLHIDGSIATSSVHIEPQGTLAGSGTIGPTWTAGTISPTAIDGSAATLTVAGDYRQTDQATLLASVDANGENSKLHVKGSAELTGGTLQTPDIKPVMVGKQYTLIDADGGLTGDFSKIVGNDYVFVAANSSVNSHRYALSIDRKAGGFAAVGDNANQRAVGHAADHLSAGNPVFDTLIVAQDADWARSSLSRLTGDSHPSLLSTLATQSRLTQSALINRGLAQPVAEGVDIWGRYLAMRSHLDSDGNAAGMNNTYQGMLFGGDTAIGQHSRAGLAFGLGSSSADTRGRDDSARIDNYTLAAYGNTDLDRVALRYGVSYSLHHIDSRRETLDGLPRSKSTYNGRTAQAYVEAGLPQQLDSLTLEPFVGLAYTYVHTNAFNESGAAGLDGESSHLNVGFTTLGLRADKRWTFSEHSELRLEGKAGWLHTLGSRTPSTRLSFQDDASFTAAGVPLARDTLLMQAALTWQHKQNTAVGLAYLGEFGKRYGNQSLSLQASWRF